MVHFLVYQGTVFDFLQRFPQMHDHNSCFLLLHFNDNRAIWISVTTCVYKPANGVSNQAENLRYMY